MHVKLVKTSLNYSHGYHYLRYQATFCVKNNAPFFSPTDPQGAMHWAFVKTVIVQYTEDFNTRLVIEEYKRKQNKSDRDKTNKEGKQKAPSEEKEEKETESEESESLPEKKPELTPSEFIRRYIRMPKQYVNIIGFTSHDFYINIDFSTMPSVSASDFIIKLQTQTESQLRTQFPQSFLEDTHTVWESDFLLITLEMAGQENINEFFALIQPHQSRPPFTLPLPTRNEKLPFSTEPSYFLRYLAIISLRNKVFLNKDTIATYINLFFKKTEKKPEGKRQRYQLLHYEIYFPFIIVEFRITNYMKPAQFVNSFRMAMSKRIKRDHHDEQTNYWDIPYFLITLDASIRDHVASFVQFKTDHAQLKAQVKPQAGEKSS